MSTITRWEIGDRVWISPSRLNTIESASRSIHAYPCNSWVKTARRLSNEGISGSVSMKFPPGYEVNVTFDDGTILQVKDHWVERTA